MLTRTRLLFTQILTIAYLCACSGETANTTPTAVVAASNTPLKTTTVLTIEQQRALETLRPADSKLAAKYGRSCFMCHANVEAKAPLAQYKSDWEPRVAKGMDTLLTHVKTGYNAMPAMGQCVDCTDVEFKSLIEFMAGTAAKQP